MVNRDIIGLLKLMSFSNRISKKWMRIILPVAVLVVGFLLLKVLSGLRPEVVKKEPAPNHPKIMTYTVRQEPIRIIIDAQGSVVPRQQTRLTARVSGHIEWVSPDFYVGGSFREGDVLLKLDPLPYESALAEAQSRLALAESLRLQEQEASEQARLDWANVGEGEPSQLVLRIPQLEKAEADLQAAKVAIQMARDNLSYTEIRAPYAGRVQSKLVDVGQAITAQATVLGEIFAVDAMEIPMALSLDDLALIPGSNNGTGRPEQVEVTLGSTIAGVDHEWVARIDRTAASVDERTRMITAYARIEPPFISDKGAPLRPGMFVRAAILGDMIATGSRIPRGAIQPGNLVYRLTADERLEAVEVDMVRSDAEWAIIANGLQPGDRLCLTPLLFFVDGMRVEPVNDRPGQDQPDTGPKS